MNRLFGKISVYCCFLATLFVASVSYGQDVRIKDIAAIKGNRINHLMGMGLVVGLAGTGDSAASLTTNKVLANFISRLGIETQAEGILTQSVAVVVVTADLPAFARNGSPLAVKASVLGDATSLAGGRLLPTRLKAGDGLVYAVAEGAILIGQANGAGAQTLTAVNLPQGGMVERSFKPDIFEQGRLTLILNQPDFTTSSRVASAVNSYFKGYYAESIDSVTIRVGVPVLFQGRKVDFISALERLTVKKDVEAVVVLNERTGTVVMGANVTILPVVVSHGDLTIQVGNDGGEVEEGKANSVVPLEGATIGRLVKSLNALGIKPKDLVGIIQGVHASGALNAKLKLM